MGLKSASVCLILICAVSGCVRSPTVARGESKTTIQERMRKQFPGKLVNELSLGGGVTRAVYEVGSPQFGNRIVVFFKDDIVQDVEYQTGR
jgi:hypothetical protein